MKILYIYRHPDMGYSIGRVFKPIEEEMHKHCEVDSVYLPVPNYSLHGLWKNIRTAQKAVKSKKYDVVHITGAEHYLVPFLWGQKVVVTVHDLAFYYLHKNKKLSYLFKHLLFVWALRFADRLVFISRKSQEECLQAVRILSGKYCIIHNPIDKSFWKSPKPFNVRNPRILHIGTRVQKNLQRTIEALANIPCTLRIIGCVSSAMQKRMDDLNINYSIAEGLSDEEIQQEYKECDIVSFPSTYEGFGMPIIEGQASGKVVVTSGIPPMNEVAGNGALFVAPCSVESLRKGYLQIIENDELRTKLTQNGSRNVDRFRLDDITNRYFRVYESLVLTSPKLETLKRRCHTWGQKKMITLLNGISNWRRRHDFDYTHLEEHRVRSKNYNYICSTSNIISYEYEGRTYFFKECRKHSDFKSYIAESIADYFDLICNYSIKGKIRQIIEADIEHTRNLKKIRGINIFCYTDYSVNKFYDGWNTEKIGLPSLFNIYTKGDDIEILDFMNYYFVEFLKYIRNEVYNYDVNKYLHKGEYQLFLSSHSVATKKLAQILNIGDIIPTVKYIKLIIDDAKEKVGICTEEAKDVCPLNLSKLDKCRISPNFQRRLLVLHIFDILCFQRDHKQENYFVKITDDSIVNDIEAFDNDSPMAFFPLPLVEFETSMRCSPIIVNGKYNRPYVCAEFAKALLEIDKKQLTELLKGDLSWLQIHMLNLRLRKMQNAIRTASWIEHNEWNEATISEEIGGNFGNTYLNHYLNVDEASLVEEIMNKPS